MIKYEANHDLSIKKVILQIYSLPVIVWCYLAGRFYGE